MAFAVPVYQSLPLPFSYGGSTVTPPTFRSRSHGIPIPMWVFSRNGWYWVNTPTVSTPELMQLLKGKSMILYFPPKDTAGFATFWVKTPRRLPCPPAKSMAIISFLITLSPLAVYFYVVQWPGAGREARGGRARCVYAV